MRRQTTVKGVDFLEAQFYRENLESVLAHFGNKHLLSPGEVCEYTGFRDNRTVRKRFPFVDGYITAETFARCLCSAQPKGLKKGRRLS